MVIDILNEKKQQLIKNDGLKDATFCKEDIDVLMDVNELRIFKVGNPMPKDFEFSASKEESIERVLNNDSIYRVLEYCVIAQPVLQISVGKVFKRWKFINGLYSTRRN